jgi:hypothetical protein
LLLPGRIHPDLQKPDLSIREDKPIPINQIRSISGRIEASRKNQVELRDTVLQR